MTKYNHWGYKIKFQKKYPIPPLSDHCAGPKALFGAFEPCLRQLLVLPFPPPNQSIFIKGSLSSEFAFGSLRDKRLKKRQCAPPSKKKKEMKKTTHL